LRRNYHRWIDRGQGRLAGVAQLETEMACPKCQTDNASGARFCMGCGGALPAPCPACSAVNPPEARFCQRCGQKLESGEAGREAPIFHDALRAPKTAPAQGERRIITALFCDVVRSTALAERLDPEDWREIMNRAFGILTGPIERYEGTVARLMGDAILAFFGAPSAHEDDPQRAVFAALEILREVKPFAAQIKDEYGLDFAVRVGINTGPVVTGDVGSQRVAEYTAMGDAVNLAARMEQAAEAGTILIAEDTQRLVAPLFELEDLGGIEVKGKSVPVRAYRVLAAKARPGRLRGIGGVSAPLIGREREMSSLREAMARVQEGSGGIVCLIGEAGLGKSRLLDEARKAWLLDNPAFSWEQVQGSPYDMGRPYGLFQKFARDMFGIELDDPPALIHEKVEKGFSGAPDEMVALCKVTMERVIAAKAIKDTRDYGAQAIKEDLYGIAGHAWENVAAGPTVCVFDDVHWADQASVDLLVHLFRVTETKPVLFVCAFRPERQSPGWQLKLKAETDYPHRYTEIALSPLDAQRTDDLVSALLNIADLPRDLRKLIIRKTEGNPYFVEEVVRSLIEQGIVFQTEDGLRWKSSTKLEDIAIPDTLHALLVARIDRLDAETRATLQLASVIGRTFFARVLKAVSDQAMALDQHLGALQRVELVREVMRKPELEYIFKHELARDAAYNTILLRRRRELHLLVGEAIEALFGDRAEEYAHRLAQHFAAGGDGNKSYRYYVMAGDAAAAMSADAEAADHFARALEAAESLDIPAAERARLQRRVATLAPALAPQA
jgi:class 3 adenylate cyclase